MNELALVADERYVEVWIPGAPGHWPRWTFTSPDIHLCDHLVTVWMFYDVLCNWHINASNSSFLFIKVYKEI